MRAGSSSTKVSPSLWLLVADGQRAQFYTLQKTSRAVPSSGVGPGQFRYRVEKKTPKLVILKDRTLEAEPMDLYKVPPKRKSKFGSATSFRHTTTPHRNTRAEIKCLHMRRIAASLKEALGEKQFDQLIVAAPPRMLGELREHLSPSVLKRVLAEVREDLMHRKSNELLSRIKHLLSAPWGGESVRGPVAKESTRHK